MYEEKSEEKGGKISIVTFVNLLLQEAFELSASDIHIDPTEYTVEIKYRVDGIIIHKHRLKKNFHAEIISRIKIISGLRTDEHLLPQDGRLRTGILNHTIDIRVSVIPSFYGEAIVLRLLRDTVEATSFLDLGFSEEAASQLAKISQKKHGMVIVTGPTGSGKTTTLYTLLKHINSGTKSIITLEDPVEYAIQNVRHIQVYPQRNFTFAAGLRAIVRQDPDVIMVGEIRDRETAAIAIQTALTGHMLFTSMHTPNAVTALPRLRDMGIDAYLIASTVHSIIGQRLIRKLCPKCKVQKTISDSEREKNMLKKFSPKSNPILPEKIFFASEKGCDACHNTGYLGRTGIYEILIMNNELRQAVMDNKPAHIFQDILKSHHIPTMHEDSYKKIILGITSLEEVVGTLYE